MKRHVLICNHLTVLSIVYRLPQHKQPFHQLGQKQILQTCDKSRKKLDFLSGPSGSQYSCRFGSCLLCNHPFSVLMRARCLVGLRHRAEQKTQQKRTRSLQVVHSSFVVGYRHVLILSSVFVVWISRGNTAVGYVVPQEQNKWLSAIGCWRFSVQVGAFL